MEKQVSKLTEEVPEEAKQGRIDLRELPLVTIDGEDARDFDDAVYCEQIPSGVGVCGSRLPMSATMCGQKPRWMTKRVTVAPQCISHRK
ncbi:hypothetical protein PCI56_20020 [Plesiomonas shigelloides subsp. oncorhynchi]|nr:hypothetical protein [Plesiomonas shigelloides]